MIAAVTVPRAQDARALRGLYLVLGAAAQTEGAVGPSPDDNVFQFG
jgi:hypothetical protein